jgi:hypothetical protein
LEFGILLFGIFTMAVFNISQIFESAFGYSAPPEFEIGQAPERLTVARRGSPYYANDILGREFFMPVTIGTQLIPFAVVGIRAKKTIVSTAMVERRGTVKELINVDDYEINIKGIIIEDNQFPEAQIRAMHELFLENNSLNIRCPLTDIFLEGDDKVVIKEMNWPQVAGVEHARPFEMVCESDLVFTLEIDD